MESNLAIHSTSTKESCTTSNCLAILKKLKIEENFLRKIINKTDNRAVKNKQDSYLSDEDNLKEIKMSLLETIDLYDNIKQCYETEQMKDINDVKDDIMNLEDKIKKLKVGLNNQINTLRNNEIQLINEINNDEITINDKDSTITHIKLFKDVVASKIKPLIDEKSKCVEVQEFHEFMSAHKQYGGWLEYNHNKFVHLWKKHFRDRDVEMSDISHSFISDIVNNIQDTTKNIVLDHIKWYLKYLQLKKKLDSAIYVWKKKKECLKKYKTSQHHENLRVSIHVKENQDQMGTRRKESSLSKLSKRNKQENREDAMSRLTLPTLQWMNRVKEDSDNNINAFEVINDINNISKRQIPVWRQILHED